MCDISEVGISHLYSSTGEVDGGEDLVEREVNVVKNVDGERKVEASSRMARRKARRRESEAGEFDSAFGS